MQVWLEVLNVSELEAFTGFEDNFSEHAQHYQLYFESTDPQKYPLMEPFESKLSLYQKLLVMRCIRPDKVCSNIR